MTEQNSVSMKPSTFVESSFLDDADVKVSEAQFVVFDYDGKANPAVGLQIVYEAESLEKPATQFYSAGDPKFFQPSKDGNNLVPMGTRTALNSGSNLAKWLTELVQAGFPEESLDGTAGAFVGIEGHVIQKAQPKLPNQEKARTLLVFTEISSLPGEEKKSAKSSGKGKSAAKKEEAESSDDDLTAAAQEAVMAILSAADGPVAKKDLTTGVFRESKDPKTRSALVKLVASDEFLENGPWTYDGKAVSL